MDIISKAEAIQILLSGILHIVVICLFIFRLKYAKKYGLTLWGIYMIMDFSFGILGLIFHQWLFPSFPPSKFNDLLLNILFIFQLGIILLTYYRFNSKNISKHILLGIFIIFFIIWLSEFAFLGIKNIDTFNYAITYLKIATVGLCWFYLLNIYKNSINSYSNIPFFWITLGWLIFNTVTAPTYTPDFDNSPPLLQGKITILFTILSLSALVFYAIGFWKTKKWILQNG